jgi:hypothetical protein
MKNVFPKRIYAHDRGSWVDSPQLAKKIWLRIKEKHSWYACDMEITSPTTLTLFVYDMADSCHGGIGNKICSKEVTGLTADEQVMLNEYVLNIYSNAAAAEFDKRQLAAQEKKILKIRKEMFGV